MVASQNIMVTRGNREKAINKFVQYMYNGVRFKYDQKAKRTIRYRTL